MGFALDKDPNQIDRALLKSLSPEDREKLKFIWAARNAGLSNGLAMYGIPKTLKQAALLFSYDWKRVEATMRWFNDISAKFCPRSVVEMGCGAGFLLHYLSKQFQELRVQGIDEVSNLVSIGSQLNGARLIEGDYLGTSPDDQYDLVVCDFGFDNARFLPSKTPHSVAEVEGVAFCPGCSQDLKVQLESYLKAWRGWSTTTGCLAIAGRFSTFGGVKALADAALEVGWVVSLEESKILVVESHGERERFPALFFVPDEGSNAPALEELARLYAS